MMISAIKRRPKALTFVELFLVVIIIGILTALSLPGLRKGLDNFELENFSRDIYYLSCFLQAGAVSQGKIYCLNLDQKKQWLWATYKPKPQDEFKRVQGKSGKIYKAPEGIVIRADGASSQDERRIYFYPDGSSDEIRIIFENRQNRKICLAIKGAQGEIQIQ